MCSHASNVGREASYDRKGALQCGPTETESSRQKAEPDSGLGSHRTDLYVPRSTGVAKARKKAQDSNSVSDEMQLYAKPRDHPFSKLVSDAHRFEIYEIDFCSRRGVPMQGLE